MNRALRSHRQFLPVLLILLFVLATYWLFFDIYRSNAFNIVPRDDFAPYLLYFVGEEGGRVLGAPFAYRVLPVLLAVPLYFAVPYFEFSLLTDPNPVYLRAVEALALTSYLSIILSCVVVYMIVCNRLRGTRTAGVLAALGSFLLFPFFANTSVDPSGVLLACLIVYWMPSRASFGVLLLLSVVVNEKISLMFAIVMCVRFLAVRKSEFLYPAAVASAAFVLYLGIRTSLDVAGAEWQLQPGAMADGLFANISKLFSLHQLVLSVLPTSLMLILYCLALCQHIQSKQGYSPYFCPPDVSALIGLCIISIAVGALVFGRMLLYCIPLYVPLASVALDALLRAPARSNAEEQRDNSIK